MDKEKHRQRLEEAFLQREQWCMKKVALSFLLPLSLLLPQTDWRWR